MPAAVGRPTPSRAIVVRECHDAEMSVPPGWYPDGVTPGVERWFDGTAWHEVTRQVGAPAPTPAAPPATPPVATPFAPPGGAPGGAPGGGPGGGPAGAPGAGASAGPGGSTPQPGGGWAALPGRPDPWPSDRPTPGAAYPPVPQWSAGPPSGPPSSSFGADPRDPLHWVLPVGRSWQSIVAGYLGLVGLLVWPLAPFAVWLGIWALQKARTSDGHGSGRAWFAIVTGVIGTAIGVYVLLNVMR